MTPRQITLIAAIKRSEDLLDKIWPFHGFLAVCFILGVPIAVWVLTGEFPPLDAWFFPAGLRLLGVALVLLLASVILMLIREALAERWRRHG